MATKKGGTTSKRVGRQVEVLKDWLTESEINRRSETGLFDYETGEFRGVRPVETLSEEGPHRGRFTRVPNEVFAILPFLKLSEIRVLLAIVRKTYGHNKREDWIALSQFRSLTMASDAVNLEAIVSLEAKGIIVVERVSKRQHRYSLKYRNDDDGTF